MQDVDTPEPGNAASCCLRHRLFVSRVCLQGLCTASGADDLPGSLLGSSEIAVDRNYGRPFPAEQERRSPAVPDRRSRGLSCSHDEGYTIFEQHVVQFSSLWPGLTTAHRYPPHPAADDARHDPPSSRCHIGPQGLPRNQRTTQGDPPRVDAALPSAAGCSLNQAAATTQLPASTGSTPLPGRAELSRSGGRIPCLLCCLAILPGALSFQVPHVTITCDQASWS